MTSESQTEPTDQPDTPLARALGRRPRALKAMPMDAFQLARQRFLEGRRVSMGHLADELRVSRATLYRWCGSREMLLGEVIWSLAENDLDQALARSEGTGRTLVTNALRHAIIQFRSSASLQRFASDDPQYALRILTAHDSAVQVRLTTWCAALLRRETQLRPDFDLDHLAYVIVRICESFVWSDMIIGTPLEPDPAIKMIELLISAAEDRPVTPPNRDSGEPGQPQPEP